MSRRLRARAEWNRAGRPLTEFDGRRIWQHVTIDGPRRPWTTALWDALSRGEWRPDPLRRAAQIIEQLNRDYGEYLPPGASFAFDTTPLRERRR